LPQQPFGKALGPSLDAPFNQNHGVMTMAVKMADLLAKRAQMTDKIKSFADKLKDLAAVEKKTDEQKAEFKAIDAEFIAVEGERKALDEEIAVIKRVEAASAEQAIPVEGQRPTVPAGAKEKTYPIGSLVKALHHAQGNVMLAAQWAEKNYGEGHAVTKALNTSTAAAGAAMLPEDFANQVVELLRPATVVRSSDPVVVPMPRGTMRMGKQTGGVTGSYGAEGSKLGTQQPTVGNIVATFKKLTVLVPVSNDFLRYASPATDGLVQNDVVQGLARTEDLAFIRGDGTADWPLGLRNICLSGNLISSNATFTLTTVDSELGSAILALENANVPMIRPTWFFAPRIKQFLLTLKNSNGFYVYRDEMVNNGTLRGYPFKTTTQIPTTLTDGTQTEIYFTDMSQAMIFDALALSLGMSQDGAYTDAGGNQRNAFERDETLIRAIAEHDFHLRHDEATAVITAVKWA
jgi:HK97 family phage major capsid protein